MITQILIIVLVSAVLSSTVLSSTAQAYFKVIVKVLNVNSYSGEHKVSVSIPDHKTQSKTRDLGTLANYWDDSEIQLSFTFSHVPTGQSFKACLDKHNCASGINTPAKRPESIELVLPDTQYMALLE